MSNFFVKGNTNDYSWRLEMGTVLIDIDNLLEATSDLTSEKNSHNVKKVEIDQLLENTRDW